ncbi:MAG TPA: DUF2786 domain-containing protein [Pseudonocardia sp.]
MRSTPEHVLSVTVGTLGVMGMRNRERRAAKQRARRRTSTCAGPVGFEGRSALPSATELAGLVLAAAQDCAAGVVAAADECASALVDRPFADSPMLVARAVELAALDGLTHAWRRGWLPADLWQIAGRDQPAAVSYLVDMLAADARRHPAAAVHPAWRAQLDRLSAQVWWQPDEPHLDQWSARHRVGRHDVVAIVVRWLAQLWMLPKMSELIPPPGSPAAATAHAARGRGSSAGGRVGDPGGVDPKMLTRVRALLAKAESTEFAEEADAFFAKAQELMTRYSLERAMLFADGDIGSAGPGGRRIWLDAPYLSAKSMLVDQVARANRAKAVFHARLGCLTVLGDEVDLELVEVLSTSLLVHASGTMVAAGRQLERSGQSRTKSFRQSFLVSYATRIGERLTATDVATSQALADELGDGRLLPVLAARTEEVDKLYRSLFPQVRSRRLTVSNDAGWGAGRVAADLADLDVRRAVGG